MAIDYSYMGTVELWAGTYNPRGWAFCQGQLLSIAQFSALFSLLGCTYGGDCRTNFALPDMRGRIPIGAGQSAGTGNYYLGTKSYHYSVTLTTANLPSHTHSASLIPGSPESLSGRVFLPVKTGFASGGKDPVDKYFGGSGGTNLYYDDYTSGSNMEPINVDISGGNGTVTINNSGGSHPFYPYQPFTTLNYIICMQGVYPQRA